MGKVWKRHLHRTKVQAARDRREKIFAVLQPEPVAMAPESVQEVVQEAIEQEIVVHREVKEEVVVEPEALTASSGDVLEAETPIATPIVAKPRQRKPRKARKTRKTTVKKVAPLEVIGDA